MPDRSDEDIDELLVYDSKRDDYVQMGQVPITEKDKQVLQVLNDERFQDEDGYVVISEVKDATDIKRRNIRTRFDKFGERYEEILNVTKVDPSETHLNTPPTKARLTDTGQELINRGLIGSLEDNIPEKITLKKEDYENLKSRIDSLEEEVETANAKLSDQRSQMSKINSSMDDIKQDIEHLYDWKGTMKEFVLGVKLTLQESGLPIREKIKEAKNKLKKEELKNDD